MLLLMISFYLYVFIGSSLNSLRSIACQKFRLSNFDGQCWQGEGPAVISVSPNDTNSKGAALCQST